MIGNSCRYTIDVDTGRRLVTVTTNGFWEQETLQPFSLELRRAIGHASQIGRGRAARVLIDARQSSVHSPEVVKGFQALSEELAGGTGRVAALVSGSLHKLQANRIASTSDNHRVFIDEEEALTWLLG